MATQTDLGKWMITNGGDYDPTSTYEQLTMVMHENSTYITLKTVSGITPVDDKINYILMAKGYEGGSDNLSSVIADDKYGVMGTAGSEVSAQSLVDYITNEVINNLVKKSQISNVQVNDQNKVPSSALAYSMQQQINDTNSNLDGLISTAARWMDLSNYDLIASASGTNNEQTIPTPDLGQYKLFMTRCENKGNHGNGTPCGIILADIFKISGAEFDFKARAAGADYWNRITYINTTTVKIHPGSTYLSVELYGLK